LEWSFYRNQSWDDDPDLFGIKIARDLVGAFLKHPTLSVFLPDFLNYCGNRKQDVGYPFHHFQRFYSLTDLLEEFSCFYDIFLFLCTFFPLTFCSPGERGNKNAHFSQSSDRMGEWYLRWFDRLCRPNG
jgi:hypothetical protein